MATIFFSSPETKPFFHPLHSEHTATCPIFFSTVFRCAEKRETRDDFFVFPPNPGGHFGRLTWFGGHGTHTHQETRASCSNMPCAQIENHGTEYG
jgi:hypothetical protein